jgi:hypothetical protein
MCRALANNWLFASTGALSLASLTDKWPRRIKRRSINPDSLGPLANLPIAQVIL